MHTLHINIIFVVKEWNDIFSHNPGFASVQAKISLQLNRSNRVKIGNFPDSLFHMHNYNLHLHFYRQ